MLHEINYTQNDTESDANYLHHSLMFLIYCQKICIHVVCLCKWFHALVVIYL